MDLSKYTKPTLDEWREVLNLTEDEEKVFLMLAKKKSILEIANKLQMSESTVSRRIRNIKDKMEMVGK